MECWWEGWGPEGWAPNPEKKGGLKGGASEAPRDSPNSLSFFPLSGGSRGILALFLKVGNLKCARLGSQAVM